MEKGSEVFRVCLKQLASVVVTGRLISPIRATWRQGTIWQSVRLVILALAMVSTPIVAVPKADAGTFDAYLCQSPAGEAVGTSGLQELLIEQAPFVSGEALCAQAGQEILMQLGPNLAGYVNLQGGQYIYAPPVGVSIVAYSLRINAYAAPCGVASGHCPGGVGQVFITHTGQVDPNYDFRDLGEGVQGPTTVVVSRLRGVSDVLIGATCDSGCPSSQAIASFAIPQARFTLVDSTVPKVMDQSGPSESTGVVSGDVEWSYVASDPGGSGIFTVTATADGRTMENRVLDENGGLCRNLGTTGERVFSSPQPCAPETIGSASLDTDDLTDGKHLVRVYVDDAAGDAANVFSGTLDTANGPIVDQRPTVSGVPEVGATLLGSNAVFSPRPEQEMTGAASGRWERCVARGSCQPIEGASGTSYVPTAADVGHELVYQSVGITKVTDAVAAGLTHVTTVDSIPTLAVSEAGGSSAVLGNRSAWRISLKVSPRRVHQHTTIRLSGRVATVPRPSMGKLVYLEAREKTTQVRRSRRWRAHAIVYGRWITFMLLRAKSNGQFSTTYTFRLGGNHTYQFRAVAPAEGQFRNVTGSSAIVTVHEA
jgi:hypothetical protein